MIIYPTIELQNGRCVSLTRGDLDQPQIWHVDPVEKACEFAQAGATWMQVTDFDAVAGRGDNKDIVENIIRHAGLSVQVAGGVRALEQIDAWVNWGAGRVVVGTAAVLNPQLIVQAAKRYPDQIVVAVDVMDGWVMTEGWKTQSAIRPEGLLNAFKGLPLAAVLFTDIDSDLVEGEASLSRITALSGLAHSPVIASGLVKSIDDISRLKYMGTISGAIVGRALFNKAIDLTDALEMAQPSPEPVAEFI